MSIYKTEDSVFSDDPIIAAERKLSGLCAQCGEAFDVVPWEHLQGCPIRVQYEDWTDEQNIMSKWEQEEIEALQEDGDVSDGQKIIIAERRLSGLCIGCGDYIRNPNRIYCHICSIYSFKKYKVRIWTQYI